MSCAHCAKLKDLNFLQNHYNQNRDEGVGHAMYAVVNDLSDETAAELKKNYEATHPPVPKEKEEEFQRKFSEEAREAEARDDLAWLTGTGRFSQD